MRLIESDDIPESPVAGPTVIKVGGSLLDWPELPRLLGSFLNSHCKNENPPRTKVLLIVGGGAAGDLIRTMDRIHGLGDKLAHRLAIHALDLSAQLLGSLLPGSVVVDRPDVLRSVWTRGEIPILAPRRFLEEVDDRGPDPLPASWDVTTDSIAARIAIRLEASRLVLLKSTRLPSNMPREEAARLGLVDRMFPLIASELKIVEYVSFREPNPLPLVLPP
jgi:5-(aminomethyl)-3-furanmethanol phosphate kinase